MNSVNWHAKWLSVMCTGLMAFMLFGVFLSTGCASKDDTPPPVNTACVVGSGDSDGDGILDTIDVDSDGDGLIEICTLGELHNIRYNLTGTSYKTKSSGDGDKAGCGGADAVTVCNGYELGQDLSFDKGSNGTWSGDSTAGYTLDANDNADPYFVVSEGGWKPIGIGTAADDNEICKVDDTCFNAIFEGNGHTITGLAIRRRDVSMMGMFGGISANADIRNIGLVKNLADYTGSFAYIGGLVGFQVDGSITASYATGDVNGGDGNDGDIAGGLVGFFQGDGSITASYATGDVNEGDGDGSVGGLVGAKMGVGSITASYATGDVNGGDGNDAVGGLVGYRSGGSITASYATGAVNGGDGNDAVGGLVGSQDGGGDITDSYGFGTATGEMDDEYGTSIPSSIGSTGTATERAAMLMSNNAGMSWDDPTKNTKGAWSFVVGKIPALKYADYDGTGTTFYCDSVTPRPTTGISIPNCGDLISGQR